MNIPAMHVRSEDATDKMKRAWLRHPTQFARQGQWWSILAMHMSQTLQFQARSSLGCPRNEQYVAFPGCRSFRDGTHDRQHAANMGRTNSCRRRRLASSSTHQKRETLLDMHVEGNLECFFPVAVKMRPMSTGLHKPHGINGIHLHVRAGK